MSSLAQTVVEAHVQRTNPHPPGSPRDAMQAIPFDLYRWSARPVRVNVHKTIARVRAFHPADRRAVRRYAKLIAAGSEPPAIVISHEAGGRIAIHDGAHRLGAAEQAGATTILAYVGVPRS